jgi:hypothetical protein
LIIAQPQQRLQRQRQAAPGLQALVDAAHPAPASAGQDQAGDLLGFDHASRAMHMSSMSMSARIQR